MNYDRLLQLGGVDRVVPPIPGYITKEQLQGEIDGIDTLIPEDASEENKLATESSVATNSATFRGNYNLVTDLSLTTAATHSDIEAALANTITTVDNNDYCWVEIPVSDTATTEIARVERYKYDGTAWNYEFVFNFLPESLPNVNDYTSWNTAGTTEGGAGAMVVYDEDGTRKAIVAITNSYTVSNMPVGQEFYIPANAVLDGNTLITVYEDPALTVDSNIRVKISAARKSTINEALSLIYFGARNEANQYTDEVVEAESGFQKNLAAIMSLAVDPNAGVTTVTTNPEWKLVYTDAQDRILLGKRQDNTWYFATDLDTILDTIIDGYTTTP